MSEIFNKQYPLKLVSWILRKIAKTNVRIFMAYKDVKWDVKTPFSLMKQFLNVIVKHFRIKF